MKNIIIFHQNFEYGGVENSTIFLAKNFTKQGFKVHFASNFSKKFDKKILKDFDVKSFPFFRLRYNFFNIFFYLLQFKIRKKEFLVISNQFNLNIFLLIIKKFLNFKIIITERNHPIELEFKNYLVKNFYFFLIKKFYKYANYCIGNSHELSKAYSLIAGVKFVTINNSYNFNDIYNNSKKKKIYKDKKFKHNFIYVARLVGRKDPLLAVNIIKEIINYTGDKNFIKLTIIGKGNLRNTIINNINENNLKRNINIINPLKNHYPYYLASDFLISCSEYEGFPNVLIEAICLNVFPFSYNCSSGPDEILSGGKGGVLFNTRDPKKIAKLIISSLKQKQKLVKKLKFAKKNIHKYDFRKVIFQYYNIIKKLI